MSKPPSDLDCPPAPPPAVTGEADSPTVPTSDWHTSLLASPLPVFRASIGGVLMGLANLVPGVSGGTMILVMGLYDDFISSIADITRLRFTRRNVVFMAIVGASAVVAIAALAGTLSRAVTLHRSAMFALFIGLTLGGVPLLVRMLGRPTVSSGFGLVLGLALMILVVATRADAPTIAMNTTLRRVNRRRVMSAMAEMNSS